MPKRSKEEITKNMRAIRSKNTKIEIILGKALWHKGYRYRKHNKKVFGTPDFTFKKLRIAIFCDSGFWHGKDWDALKKRMVTNTDFWVKKIERNRARDIKVNQQLVADGWTVIRFWEMEINKKLGNCLEVIEKAIHANSLLLEWKLMDKRKPGEVLSLQTPLTGKEAYEYLLYLLGFEY